MRGFKLVQTIQTMTGDLSGKKYRIKLQHLEKTGKDDAGMRYRIIRPIDSHFKVCNVK